MKKHLKRIPNCVFIHIDNDKKTKFSLNNRMMHFINWGVECKNEAYISCTQLSQL